MCIHFAAECEWKCEIQSRIPCQSSPRTHTHILSITHIHLFGVNFPRETVSLVHCGWLIWRDNDKSLYHFITIYLVGPLRRIMVVDCWEYVWGERGGEIRPRHFQLGARSPDTSKGRWHVAWNVWQWKSNRPDGSKSKRNTIKIFGYERFRPDVVKTGVVIWK